MSTEAVPVLWGYVEAVNWIAFRSDYDARPPLAGDRHGVDRQKVFEAVGAITQAVKEQSLTPIWTPADRAAVRASLPPVVRIRALRNEMDPETYATFHRDPLATHQAMIDGLSGGAPDSLALARLRFEREAILGIWPEGTIGAEGAPKTGRRGASRGNPPADDMRRWIEDNRDADGIAPSETAAVAYFHEDRGFSRDGTRAVYKNVAGAEAFARGETRRKRRKMAAQTR